MADLGGQFNADEVEPLGEYQPIPAGDYRVAVVKSEWKPTKNGNGRYIEFGFQILEGPSEGRMVFSRLNLENPNQTAVNIARSELSSICHAVGKLKPRDTTELHNVPLIVSVELKKRSDSDGYTNEIKKYSSVSSARAAENPAVASTGSYKPSWM